MAFSFFSSDFCLLKFYDKRLLAWPCWLTLISSALLRLKILIDFFSALEENMHRLSLEIVKTASLNYSYWASDLHMKIRTVSFGWEEVSYCSAKFFLDISIAPQKEKLSSCYGSWPSIMFNIDASLYNLPWLDCMKSFESLNLLLLLFSSLFRSSRWLLLSNFRSATGRLSLYCIMS